MTASLLLTVFIVGDGDGDDVTGSHHGAAPMVPERRPKMHLELLLGLKHRVVVDVNCAVFHLGGETTEKRFVNVGFQRVCREFLCFCRTGTPPSLL